MVGSDGKTYHFSLQWAVPYWTRTEERTAQLFYLMDRILRRGILSARNSLSVQPTGVVPIAQRLRITPEESTRVSLEDVFRLWCEKRGTSIDAASKCFHDEFLKLLEDNKSSDMDDDAKAQADEEARLHAYTKVRETRVQANLLLEYMHEKLDGPEQLFHFRRNFAGQLSADALIQHAFCVVERNPSRTVFLERNGRVLSPDYRFEYNNHGECSL
jgi:transformation/transcription domain-associated protein